MRKTITLIFLILATTVLVFSTGQHEPRKRRFIPTGTSGEECHECGAGDHEPEGLGDLRSKQFFEQRAFPTGEIPKDWQLKAFRELRALERSNQRETPQTVTNLTPLGPTTIKVSGLITFAGRVTALAGDPQDPATIYVGAAGGGLWRSSDQGLNWKPLIDGAPTQAVGAIAIDPTNRNTIYVGTGDGLLAATSFSSMGILKSTDSGQTWVTTAVETFAGLGFNRLLVDPQNPETLYAAVGSSYGGIGRAHPSLDVTNGIYKSTDGGVTWNPILLGKDLGDTPYDLVFNPKNPTMLYAAFNDGVYQSMDAGRNWTKLGGGLPANDTGHPRLAISPSNPALLYLAFTPYSDFKLRMMKSTNGGTTWTSLAVPTSDEFAGILQVHPSNPDSVIFGGYALYLTSDGGKSWGPRIFLHSDYNAFAFVSGDPNQLFVGNDGGVWYSPDSGKTFLNRNTNLAITQFYSLALHPTDPNTTIGGTQDNGTDLFSGNSEWQLVFGGDGGFTGIDQTNPNVMYTVILTANSQGQLVRAPVKSDQGGVLGSWKIQKKGIDPNDFALLYPPLVLDPNNQSTLYYGTSRLYRSTQQGKKWAPISPVFSQQYDPISAIAPAPGAANVVYVGFRSGAVFVTRTNGAKFDDVTGDLPHRYVSRLVVPPNAPQTVFAALSGFHSGHIFKSETGGGTWRDISGNLPDVPCNALVSNPADPNNLFVGTDIGLFVTENGGITWMKVPGMPSLPVLDIGLNPKLGLLRVATHGRGLYQAGLISGKGKAAN